MTLDGLRTPALILDSGILRRNLAAMSERIAGLGLDLRPHMKTSKCAEIAKLATAGHSGGICVSTVAEAVYFARHGFKDITYAFGIAPDKIEALAALVHDGVDVSLLLDDAGVARAVAERAAALDTRFDVLVEIDSGMHRAGIDANAPALLEIGRILEEAPAVRLGGVLSHGGQSYDCRGAAECRIVAEEERLAVATASSRLRDAGLPCPRVAPGSTPTAVHAQSAEGITEMRPGNYMFFDLHQLGIGACGVQDIAVSVLAQVVGHNRGHNRILIDAGALALSKDNGAQDQIPDSGYGWVFDRLGQARIGDLRVTALSQEHGTIESDGPLPFDHLPIGARVRVLPSHSCLTAAAYGRYNLVDGGAIVTDVWERMGGW